MSRCVCGDPNCTWAAQLESVSRMIAKISSILRESESARKQTLFFRVETTYGTPPAKRLRQEAVQTADAILDFLQIPAPASRFDDEWEA